MKTVKYLASLVAAVACCLLAHADTWYADAAHYGLSGMDGRSPETAFGTIQEAVNCTSPNDTVLVAEGVYDKGAPTCAPDAMDARVSITNKITVKASGAKEKTVIVGRHASTSSGIGADAIRCVYIDAACSGVVIRGFTLRDGGVRQSDSTAAGCSGGVYAGTHYSLGDLIIDCDIVNCAGSRGGAVKGGVSVRCRYFGSRCDYTGAIGRDSAFWNCLFVANGQRPNLFEGCRLVNCSVIGNATSVFSSDSYALNTICAGNDGNNCRSDMKTCKGSVFTAPNEAGAKEADGMENVVYDNAAENPLIAPLFGDFRVVQDHPAATSGRLAYMTAANIHSYIPADERYIDLNGNPIVERNGSICAGALQETVARATAGGGILGAGVGKWTVCGVPTTTDTLWAFPTEYPTFMKIDCFKDTDIVAFAYSSAFNDYRQPLMDGTICVMPPVRTNALQPIEPIFADKVLYVNPDPAVGSDTSGNGTAAVPYETISKAVAMSPTKTVVKIVCAAGTYAKAGDLAAVQSHQARVYIPENMKIFLKGAGVGKSVIKGVAVEGGTWGGCGEQAAKCLVIDGSACGVQGFTLQDGFAYGVDVNEARNQGGAIRAHISATVENVIVSDVLIDNSGSRSGAVFGGNYERCEFTRCTAPYGIIREAGFVTSCYLHGNDSTQYGSLFYEYPVYDTTVIARANQAPFPSGQEFYNSVCCDGAFLGSPKYPEVGFPGCLCWALSSQKVTPEAGFYVYANPQFVRAVSAGDGDGRLLSTSPAFGTAGVELYDDNNWMASYNRYATTDLKGCPRQFVNGKTVPGAFTWAASKVSVSAPKFGTTVPEGDTFWYPGESVTIRYQPDPDPAKARHFLGYETNGVLVTASTTLTIDPIGSGLSYSFDPVVSTNWYVNANAANDLGDGFTPETAKKTLRAIMEDVYIQPGDCVHAAEGDYNQGMMFPQNGTAWGDLQLTSNRVVVAENISLVADGAKERTIIRGIKGNVSTGCGPGALRCVYMYPNSLLKGFTLADGATATHATPTGSSNDDYSGGGVLTYGVDATAYVENCTFTNCSARNGGGAFGGYLVNCRFTGCRAAASGGALRNCWRLYGCVVESGSINGPYGVDSCTFGPESVLDYGNSSGSYVLKNSLVLGKLTVSSSYKFKVSNSLFVEGCGISEAVVAGYATLDKPETDIVLPAERLAVDADYMPAKDSALVDAGLNSDIPAQLHGRDALGHQRIWNGTVDIGAVEYDWRGDFTAALGGGQSGVSLQVTEASPDVLLVNGSLQLMGGASLTCAWSGLRPNSIRSFAAQVAGSGTLSVGLNGEPLMSLEAADTGLKKYRAAGTEDELAFAYDGIDFASIGLFRCNPGFMMIVH